MSGRGQRGPIIVGLPLAALALLTAPSQAPRASLRESAPGITFSIDTAPDGGPAPGVFKTFGGVVLFAAGRGRLDIVAKSGGPAILVEGIGIAAPLARPGEYYLFDSTGFILVRPTTKTFSSFVVTDASYNYRNNRDGWPSPFRISPLHLDTLGANERLAQHGPIHIYWHMETDQGNPTVHLFAAGRLAIDDAPPGEVSVVRWFGPSEALANMPTGAGALQNRSLGITVVALLSPPGDNRAPIEPITLHAILGLKNVDVDLSRLVLPNGFTETQWPGFDGPTLPALSPDQGAKWRAMPR